MSHTTVTFASQWSTCSHVSFKGITLSVQLHLKVLLYWKMCVAYSYFTFDLDCTGWRLMMVVLTFICGRGKVHLKFEFLRWFLGNTVVRQAWSSMQMILKHWNLQHTYSETQDETSKALKSCMLIISLSLWVMGSSINIQICTKVKTVSVLLVMLCISVQQIMI